MADDRTRKSKSKSSLRSNARIMQDSPRHFSTSSSSGGLVATTSLSLAALIPTLSSSASNSTLLCSNIVDSIHVNPYQISQLTNQQIEEALSHSDYAYEIIRTLECQGKLVNALQSYLLRDLEQLVSAQTLFREDSIGTKLLASCANMRSSKQFLSATVIPLVHQIRAYPRLYEVDPNRIEKKEITSHQQALRSLVSNFLTRLQDHIGLCSATLRYVLSVVENAVNKKFPGQSVLTSLFFLRFLCPTIVRCDQYIKSDNPMSVDERRALVLVTKILQAMANEVELKEPYLAFLNGFVAENASTLRSLCSRLINENDIRVATLAQLSWNNDEPYIFNSYPRSEMSQSAVVTFAPPPPMCEFHPLMWTTAEVEHWLESIGLSEIIAPLSNFSGSDLLTINDDVLVECRVPKPLRKPFSVRLQELISTRTVFFPAFKAPQKWSHDEVVDWLGFMELNAFSFLIRSIGTDLLPGRLMFLIREDQLMQLGIEEPAYRRLIMDRICDALFAQIKIDSRSGLLTRRSSAPPWIERMESSTSCESEASLSHELPR